MKGHFDKNLRELLEEKNKTLDDLSQYLKISKSSVNNILNNKFDDFSSMSLRDISQRLSSFFGENINYVEEEKKENNEIKFKEKRKSPILFIMILLIIISSTYIFFVLEDVLYFSEVLNENRINIEIENTNENDLLVNGEVLEGMSMKIYSLSREENIVVNDNNGVTIIRTPNSEYEIKLEDFEVIFKNGQN
ncbi:MAG: helix-turn-helix domain-containing protein [Thermotogota bacterium]